MKSKKYGIVLIILGLIMLTYTGFNYVTTEKVVDIGPIEITKKKNHFVQWPPIVGILLVVGGAVVFVMDKKV